MVHEKKRAQDIPVSKTGRGREDTWEHPMDPWNHDEEWAKDKGHHHREAWEKKEASLDPLLELEPVAIFSAHDLFFFFPLQEPTMLDREQRE